MDFRSGRMVAVVAAAVVAVIVLVVVVAGRDGPDASRTDQRIMVADGIELATTLWVPDGVDEDTPAPAVLLAHGFGGSKASVVDDAAALAARGYVVLAWSLRGFGASDGVVGLQAPDAEVADVSVLVDWLADRPDVMRDGPDDPRVGMTGASYGGGGTLLAGAADDRIDALVAVSAWNSLPASLAPNSADAAAPGVLKLQWASTLFAAGSTPGGLAALAPAPSAAPTASEAATPSPGPADPEGAPASPCGRFDPALCQAYAASAEQGRLTDKAAALLGRADLPDRLGDVTAPTLLVHARGDTLFPLSESVANATGLATAGTTVHLAWLPGGHAIGTTEGNDDIVRARTGTWFDRWLREDESVAVGPAFTSVDRAVGDDRSGDDLVPSDATTIWALSGDGTLAGPDAATAGSRSWLNPPGGVPAALTSLPGLGGFADLLPPTDLPGQHVAFDGPALDEDLDVVGAPTLEVRVTSSTDGVVLFAKVLDVAPDGSATLPQQAVAPVRLDGMPTTTTITLPTIDHRFAVGHRLRLVLAATDQAYATPREPAQVTVATGPGSSLTVPTAPIAAADRVPLQRALAIVAGLVLAVAAGILVARRRRRRDDDSAPDPAAPAVAIRGLRKTYASGFVAVDGVDLTVEPGQVFGLLGPNGAGKTSTLRIVLGLSMPTAGTVHLLGHEVAPGHPVLRHVGALVEGPGFAPYRTGMENLVDFWRAGGGSMATAHLDRALDVAALGEAIDRPVGTYSHGMRQRLGIAQALLGDPPLLVLDEPTDGLDPGQIRGMRDLLASLATEGRTVLVSSHLLAEVEQVCSHAAVLVDGRVVASGPVAEIGGEARTVEFRTDDPDAARAVLVDVVGADRVQRQGPGLLVDVGDDPVRVLVAALVTAGVGVRAVTPRRRLEDAFLRLVDGGRR